VADVTCVSRNGVLHQNNTPSFNARYAICSCGSRTKKIFASTFSVQICWTWIKALVTFPHLTGVILDFLGVCLEMVQITASGHDEW